MASLATATSSIDERLSTSIATPKVTPSFRRPGSRDPLSDPLAPTDLQLSAATIAPAAKPASASEDASPIEWLQNAVGACLAKPVTAR